MKKALLVLVCLSQIAGTASANPIGIVKKLYAELTGRTHVRIRYHGNRGGRPDDVVTFGSSHSEWFTTGESVSENTGSGTETMLFQYMCDCFVPTGSPLTYTSPSASSMSSYYAESMSFTVTPYPMRTTLCDDKCPSVDPADAGQAAATGGSSGSATGGSSGSITTGEPSASVAGSNTATGAASGGSGSDERPANGGASAGHSAGDATAMGGNWGTSAGSSASDSVTTNKTNGSACSFTQHGRASALSLLLALGLVALSWRRRR